MSRNTHNDVTVIGQITSVYGVKGWVKVFSYTEPMDSILTYSPWLTKVDGQWKPLKTEAVKQHGKGFIAKLVGIDDRDIARKFCGMDIAIETSLLPFLAEGEFYWSQLENLIVYTLSGQLLGRVSHLMETGANDVIIVKGDAESIDRRERMIPYLPDQVIKEIDLESGTMRIDWDPEF